MTNTNQNASDVLYGSVGDSADDAAWTLAQAAADESDPLEAHILATLDANREAFRGDVVRDYKQGDCVWVHDHYNTGHINGPVGSADDWSVTTSDADGISSHYVYAADQLRPAPSPVEFRWPAPATSTADLAAQTGDAS